MKIHNHFVATVITLLLLLLLPTLTFAAPATFEKAKIAARQSVYHDRTQVGTLYCGCSWEWMGRSGGRVDLASCDYEIRAQEARAARTEWEHILPASSFGRLRQCWQDGGRANCNRADPVFNMMEADLHNLTPAIGEVNADRSDFNFGMLPTTPYQHGSCDFRVDFKSRTAEPRDEVKGLIARVYFYMHDRYDLPMSRQQQQLLTAWDRQFPVSNWEAERNRRIARIMGHGNPFVTGERQWSIGHRNTANGVVSMLPASHPSRTSAASNRPVDRPIIGNKNSNIYHLPVDCPSYNQVTPQNQVHFQTEAKAQAAGFRKAGNCL